MYNAKFVKSNGDVFSLGLEYGTIFDISKLRNATTINNAKNAILNTVTKLCTLPACLTPTILIIVNIHNTELVNIIDINGSFNIGNMLDA